MVRFDSDNVTNINLILLIMETILFEAQFNNNSKLICRTFATSKEDAIKQFKEVYPNDVVTKIYEP